MDEEQIWQQLEMQNDSFWEKCMNKTCRLLSLNETKLTLKLNYLLKDEKERIDNKRNNSEETLDENGISSSSDSDQSNESKEEENDVGDDTGSDEDDNTNSEIEIDDENEKKITDFNTSKKNASLIVDDQFFKLSEMEAFLDNEDKKEINRLNGKQRVGKYNEASDTDNSIDYFDSLSDDGNSDDGGENAANEKGVMFADFFDSDQVLTETPEQSRERRRSEREAKNRRQEQRMKEDLGTVSSEDENDTSDNEEIESEKNDADKTENDLRQQRMRKRIEELEEKALAGKPWQLKGEITSSTRPKNSLLEEVLEFDSVARPPPLITERTTLCKCSFEEK